MISDTLTRRSTRERSITLQSIVQMASGSLPQEGEFITFLRRHDPDTHKIADTPSDLAEAHQAPSAPPLQTPAPPCSTCLTPSSTPTSGPRRRLPMYGILPLMLMCRALREPPIVPSACGAAISATMRPCGESWRAPRSAWGLRSTLSKSIRSAMPQTWPPAARNLRLSASRESVRSSRSQRKVSSSCHGKARSRRPSAQAGFATKHPQIPAGDA